jgi:hypothetical protein
MDLNTAQPPLAPEWIQSTLKHYGDTLFPSTFSSYLERRHKVVWGLRIDADTRRFERLFGDVTPGDLRQFNQRFCDSIAGYKVGARTEFPSLSADADVFLLAKQCLSFEPKQVHALIVHELCHWYLDVGLQASAPVFVSDIDRIKARTLYHQTDARIEHLTRHTRAFCELLCALATRAARIERLFSSRRELIELAMRFDVSGGFRF